MVNEDKPRIIPKDILSFNFYTYGQPFTGSFRGMRYRVKMEKRELPLPEDAKEGDKPPIEKYFSVYTWPEPFAFDVTPEEQKKYKEFPFNEEEYLKVVEYLNESWVSHG